MTGGNSRKGFLRLVGEEDQENPNILPLRRRRVSISIQAERLYWEGWPYNRAPFPVVDAVLAGAVGLRTNPAEQAQVDALKEGMEERLPSIPLIVNQFRELCDWIERLQSIGSLLRSRQISFSGVQRFVRNGQLSPRELEMFVQTVEAIVYNGLPLDGVLNGTHYTVDERKEAVRIIEWLIPRLPSPLRHNYRMALHDVRSQVFALARTPLTE